MARFDVRPLMADGTLVLELQADLLEGLNTRLVAPLLPEEQAPQPAEVLNPVFTIDRARFVLVTQFLSSVPRSALGPPEAQLDFAADTIIAAVDLLTKGFDHPA